MPEHQSIEVTVTFPLGQTNPLHEREPASETPAELIAKALGHFGIQPEGTTSYYLIHNGQRVDGGIALGELAGPAGALKFTLVKELIQG